MKSPREKGAVRASRFVEHGHMRLDAMLVDQPAGHLGRTIGAVAHEPEAIHGALDHAPGGQNLGLPDRGGRLHIDNDRVLGIDQVVGRVGEEGLSAMSAGPARRRTGRRDETGRDLGRRPERRVVQHRQILVDRPVRVLRRQALVAVDALLPVGIRLDRTGIDCKAFGADQPLPDTAAQNRLAHRAEGIALAEAVMPVLEKVERSGT